MVEPQIPPSTDPASATPPCCFRVPRLGIDLSSLPPPRLTSRQAEAVAALLPILMCGEESAILTFAALGAARPSLKSALARISAEEQAHESLLRRLRSALPASLSAQARRTTRRFFLHLDDHDIGLHCVRIAALDSAVCILLGALRAARRPLANESSITPVITRIHTDEARHVRITSRIAAQLTSRNEAMEAARVCRSGLLQLLQPTLGELEWLGVDPDLMSRRLLTLPRSLFV